MGDPPGTQHCVSRVVGVVVDVDVVVVVVVGGSVVVVVVVVVVVGDVVLVDVDVVEVVVVGGCVVVVLDVVVVVDGCIVVVLEVVVVVVVVSGGQHTVTRRLARSSRAHALPRNTVPVPSVIWAAGAETRARMLLPEPNFTRPPRVFRAGVTRAPFWASSLPFPNWTSPATLITTWLEPVTLIFAPRPPRMEQKL